MINCKKAENYLKERKRMCERSKCNECSIGSNSNGTYKICRVFENDYPSAAIGLVQKWSDEHPQKTYLTDFLDKHPNAPLTNGIPSGICPYYLGYMAKKEFVECSTNCQKCWNTAIVERKE